MVSKHTVNIPGLATGPSLDSVISSVCSISNASLCGVGGGGLAPFLLRLFENKKKKIVILTQDFTGAKALSEDLAYHLQACSDDPIEDQVLLFPPFDYDPYDELAPDRRALVARSRTLFQLLLGVEWRFLILSAEVIQRRVISKKEFETSCLAITVGDKINREDLVELLDRGGYHRSPIVEEPGTYAVRGSLVDIFPPYLDSPVRMDTWGWDVERIRHFDVETQKSGEEKKDFWIHPVRLVQFPSSEKERLEVGIRLRALCDEVDQPTSQTELLIEDILSGRLIVGSQGFDPAFHPLKSLVDYFPKDVIGCVENPESIRLSWQKSETLGRVEYDRRIESGTPAFPPSNFWTEATELENFFISRMAVFVHPLSINERRDDPFLGANDAIDLQARYTSDLGERLRHAEALSSQGDNQVSALASHLKALTKEGYKTTVVAHTKGQADRLASMLRGRGLSIPKDGKEAKSINRSEITVRKGDLTRGCVLPGDGLCWIAEEEVFGRRSRRRRLSSTKKRISLDDLRMLKPGDFVVHAEHGIGRYEGLKRRKIRSSEMDFLLIYYKGDDKLYVPVYRLNQIQKHRGAEAKSIQLDKLGGQTFAKALGAAKKASREMAGKLLDLYARRAASTRTPVASIDDLYREFEATFPFEETRDQERAIDEVMTDLESDRPMDRLVCGDVGFGKTEVALRAAFRIAMEGRQVAVLVPTTVLAQQHFQTFSARLSAYPIKVEMLSRFRSPKQNRDSISGIKDGTLDVVIGTHRLLSKDVHFKNLGLLVIDEEHRFGVAHKERIRALRASVDTLVLTATPIPRTLQMAFSGIRDLSLIGTAPAARRPVKTMICHDEPSVIGRAIDRELARQGQVFYVHNRVRDIHRVEKRIQKLAPTAKIAVGHGQMKEDMLERVMLDFVAGRYDILVCTSIIESGLDIPRANTIIIDRADTFGMAQLYQIRGRVGRSNKQAYAYLTVPPMSALSEDAKERVETLARHSDLGSGFSVATMDMEIRGAGNLLGPEQSGSISAVGFEMFCNLVAEATSELRGEKYVQEVEPELTFEQPGYIPEDYLPEVGQRLQYYKRLASAPSEEEVESVAASMVDRFGALPLETEELVKVMVVKALARGFGLRGVEVSVKWLTVHLAPDSKVEPDSVIKIINEEKGRARLTDDLKIKLRLMPDEQPGPAVAIHFLHRLKSYDINPAIS